MTVQIASMPSSLGQPQGHTPLSAEICQQALAAAASVERRPRSTARRRMTAGSIPRPSSETDTIMPSPSCPVTLAHCARPVGNVSPGTERQPSRSSSGSGMDSGTSDVSSTGFTTTPRCRTRSSSGQS